MTYTTDVVVVKDIQETFIKTFALNLSSYSLHFQLDGTYLYFIRIEHSNLKYLSLF